ncbi:hypothetical protein LTS15_000149 [Exophiala xenobiotica]|nr:hypothetical protein LTS15_000149 [Exophiala xenobiotica]
MDTLTDIEVKEALLQIQRRKTALELKDLDHQEQLILLRSAKKDNRPFIKSELTPAPSPSPARSRRTTTDTATPNDNQGPYEFIDLTSDTEEALIKKEKPTEQFLVKVENTEEKLHFPESTPATRITASTPTKERIECESESEGQTLLDTFLQQPVPEQEKGRTDPDPDPDPDPGLQVQTVVPATGAEQISEPDVQTDERPAPAAAAPTPTPLQRTPNPVNRDAVDTNIQAVAQPAGRRGATGLRPQPGSWPYFKRRFSFANSFPQSPNYSYSCTRTPAPTPTPIPPTRAKRQRKAPSDRETEYRSTTPTPGQQGLDHGDTEHYPNSSAPNPAPNRTSKKQQEIDDDADFLNETFSKYGTPSSRKRPRLPVNYYREDITLPLLSRYCRHALQDVLDSVDPNLAGAFNDAFNAAWTKLDRCDFSDMDSFVSYMMRIIEQIMPPAAPGPAGQANISSSTQLARSRQILLRWYAGWDKCLLWSEHNGKTEAERLRAVDRWVNDGTGTESA